MRVRWYAEIIHSQLNYEGQTLHTWALSGLELSSHCCIKTEKQLTPKKVKTFKSSIKPFSTARQRDRLRLSNFLDCAGKRGGKVLACFGNSVK